MYKVTKNRKCTEWPQAKLEHKSTLYTLNTYLGPNFWSVSFYDQRFPRYRTCYNYPFTTILNAPPPKKKKKRRRKKSQFHYSFNLVETLPSSKHEFWGPNLVCSSRGDVVGNFYIHMVPCQRKRKKKAKIQNLKFHKSLHNFCTDPSYRSIHDFFGEWIWCILSEEMSLEIFRRYDSMFTKMEKIKI